MQIKIFLQRAALVTVIGEAAPWSISLWLSRNVGQGASCAASAASNARMLLTGQRLIEDRAAFA